MKELRVDEKFGHALRLELVARVEKTSAAKTRKRARLWFGTGVLAGAGLLGGIGGAAAGLFVLPGGQQVTPLASKVAGTYTGTATVDLGAAPEGTTGITMELTCLTPGRFEFDDGASSSCSAADVGTRSAWTGYTVRVAPGQHTVTIRTEPESQWQLTAKYVKQQTTEWGVNAKGETYGVESQEKGAPDLIAVTATNGTRGYAYATALQGPQPTSPEDSVKNFSTPRPPRNVPVFLSDGETQVGVFRSGG